MINSNPIHGYGRYRCFSVGRPRFTADIDIVIQLKVESIKMLASELMKVSEFGYVDKDTMLKLYGSMESLIY